MLLKKFSLAWLRGVRSLRNVYVFIGMPYQQLTDELTALGVPIGSKGNLTHIDDGTRPAPADFALGLQLLVEDRLAHLMHRNVRVTLTINSPVSIAVKYQCTCKRWFTPQRDNSRRCKRCLK
jgi:hypothetical protein